jgi:hypothetical protein
VTLHDVNLAWSALCSFQSSHWSILFYHHYRGIYGAQRFDPCDHPPVSAIWPEKRRDEMAQDGTRSHTGLREMPQRPSFRVRWSFYQCLLCFGCGQNFMCKAGRHKLRLKSSSVPRQGADHRDQAHSLRNSCADEGESKHSTTKRSGPLAVGRPHLTSILDSRDEEIIVQLCLFIDQHLKLSASIRNGKGQEKRRPHTSRLLHLSSALSILTITIIVSTTSKFFLSVYQNILEISCL